MYNSEDPIWWQNLHRIFCNREPIDGWKIGVDYVYDSLYPHIYPPMMFNETTSGERVPVLTDEALLRTSWLKKLLAKTVVIWNYRSHTILPKSNLTLCYYQRCALRSQFQT